MMLTAQSFIMLYTKNNFSLFFKGGFLYYCVKMDNNTLKIFQFPIDKVGNKLYIIERKTYKFNRNKKAG